MRIKRYEAQNSRTALAMIRKEMGEDAVILATKNIPNPHGKGSHVEVLAAIDYDVENIIVPPPSSSEEPLTASSSSAATYGPGYNVIAEKKKSFIGKAKTKPVIQVPKDKPVRGEGRHSGIQSEAHDLRLRFANLLRPPTSETKEKSPSQDQPQNRSIQPKKQVSPNPEEVSMWRDQLINRIQFSSPEQHVSSGCQEIIALVGATGVGKTTTAAKLAAWYSLRQGRKVCLLSMDCYRIGATDQLRTYARIMRLPCEVVLRKPDLAKALQRHSDKLIIIDTAGKSPYDEQHIPELQEWFGQFSDISSHLVVSATTKKEDIQNVLVSYKPLGIASMVLTKLDETRAYAALCQQIAASELPISYLCTGQRVPEDFLIANKNFLDTLFKKGWPAAAHSY